jgi:hypothetical protein
MADTNTTNLSLVKPEVGASADTWGSKNNINLDTIDGLFSAGPVLKIDKGGTGAATAADARSNLGAAGVGVSNTFTTSQTITGNLTISGSVIGLIPTGTKMLFQQTSAPTGWTKDTTHDNKALRVVSGTAGAGGSSSFTTAFANRTGTTDATTAGGTVGATTLTVNQIPLHGHPFRSNYVSGGSSQLTGGLIVNANTNSATEDAFTGTPSNSAGEQIGGTGGGQSHTHTFTGTSHTHGFSLDISVAYVDLIIATKN